MSFVPALRRIALATLPLALAACAGPMGGPGHGHAHGGPMYTSSVAATQGNAASGTVMFHDMGGQLMVHARLAGLKPNAEHGFHMHEKGDCSSADGMSAGGHWNPAGKPHGAQGGDRHAGDMPNLKADAQGRADQRFVLHGVPAAELAGKAVIVHAQPDDYKTQPTGNAGGRIGCGVIARRG